MKPRVLVTNLTGRVIVTPEDEARTSRYLEPDRVRGTKGYEEHCSYPSLVEHRLPRCRCGKVASRCPCPWQGNVLPVPDEPRYPCPPMRPMHATSRPSGPTGWYAQQLAKMSPEERLAHERDFAWAKE